MALFKWRGVTITGELQAGEDHANNKIDLTNLLDEKNIILLSVKRTYRFQFSPNNKKYVIDFYKKLLLLLQSNIPLDQALQLSQADPSNLKNVISKIRELLAQGQSLASALKHYPKLFSHEHIMLIDAGERSGILIKSISQIIKIETQKYNFTKTITKKLRYPLFILIVFLCVSFGLIHFIIPQFAGIFAQSGNQLPAFTAAVVNIAHIIEQHSPRIFGALAILIVIVITLQRTNSQVTRWFQAILIRIPWLGTTIKAFEVSLWLNLLTLLLEVHMPLINATQLSNNVIKNQTIQLKLRAILTYIEAGQPLEQAMKQTGLFGAAVLQFVSIGSATGRLPQTLVHAANLSQQHLQKRLDTLLNCLEPTVMVALSCLIGAIVVAMYLPVFTLGATL